MAKKKFENLNKLLDRTVDEIDPVLQEFTSTAKFLVKKYISKYYSEAGNSKNFFSQEINKILGKFRSELQTLLQSSTKQNYKKYESVIKNSINEIISLIEYDSMEETALKGVMGDGEFLKSFYQKEKEIASNVLERILGVQSKDEITKSASDTLYNIMKKARNSTYNPKDKNYLEVTEKALSDPSLDELERSQLEKLKMRVNDALMEVHRTINQELYEEAEIEFFLYEGPDSIRTRPFCKERIGKIFHKSEILKWPKEDWLGKKPGTDSETIFIYCGGYNCRHQLLAVPNENVPQKIKEKFLNKK